MAQTRVAVRAMSSAMTHAADAAPSAVRRALLYLPGNNAKMAAKVIIFPMNMLHTHAHNRVQRQAAALDVDCVCLDLEDAVAVTKKAEARESVVKLLKNV